MKKSSDYITSFLEMISSERGVSKNTIESYSRDLQGFSFYLSSKKISVVDVKIDNIRSYLSEISSEYKESTISRKTSAIKQFFSFLLSEDEIKKDPSRLISFPKKQSNLPKFLTEKEIESLRNAVQPSKYEDLRFLVILEILVGSGLRVSEIISLKKNSFQKNIINGETYHFLIVKGKGDKERVAPLSKSAVGVIEKYISFRKGDSNYLFPSRDNSSKSITRQQIANILKKYADIANIDREKISPHILRHSFATSSLQRGVDLRMLQEVLGHSDISTTQIYTHTNPVKLKKFIHEHHPASKKETN